MPRVPALGLALTVLLAGCGGGTPAAHACRPVDSAWAISVHVTDAATRQPVANAIASTMSVVAETDSLGWLCIRSLTEQAETLSFSRPGYRDASITLSGVPGGVVAHELRLERVARPCCDLRGQWNITFHLDAVGGSALRHKRSVSGAVNLGSRYLPPERNDDLDSLVRVVRGLHQVDFTPFFGGPVARDVSTTVFGDGPDLVHEVQGSIPAGDSVEIRFIPRMSHGSLSLHGRIQRDTIRGVWVQNMYCCGAEGRFVMARVGPADTTAPAGTAARRDSGYRRTLRRAPSAAAVPAGFAPSGNWRPEFAVAPDGRLWIADGGLFVADSFGGAWRRVLGGDADPVEDDELRVGIEIAFVDRNIVLVGLPERYPMHRAPVLYRTDDGGGTWSAVKLDSLRAIAAMRATGESVWLAARVHESDQDVMLQSPDGGKTWRRMTVPASFRDVNLIYRVSASTAYVATGGDDGTPALWRTTDGGTRWVPLPTPSEQHRRKLDEHDSRIEQIASIGATVIVREHGQVFASPASSIRWRALIGIDEIASEPGGSQVFVLLDSLRPALLDKDLRVQWRSERRLPLAGSYLEQTSYHRGVGYVTEGHGSIHQVRNQTLRVLRPVPDGRRPESATILIDPRP